MESVYVGFEARDVYLSTVLSLHFVAGMKGRSEISWTVTKCGEGEGLQFLGGEESPFEHVVPDLAAFHTVNVLLRLRASVGVRCGRQEVYIPLLADDSARFGAGLEQFRTRWGEFWRPIGRRRALGLEFGQWGRKREGLGWGAQRLSGLGLIPVVVADGEEGDIGDGGEDEGGAVEGRAHGVERSRGVGRGGI